MYKVGDMIYIIEKARNDKGAHDISIQNAAIKEIWIDESGRTWITAKGYNYRMDFFLNKRVFLTNTEAEKALAAIEATP